MQKLAGDFSNIEQMPLFIFICHLHFHSEYIVPFYILVFMVLAATCRAFTLTIHYHLGITEPENFFFWGGGGRREDHVIKCFVFLSVYITLKQND